MRGIDLRRIENRVALLKGRGGYSTIEVVAEVMDLGDYDKLSRDMQHTINRFANTIMDVVVPKKSASREAKEWLRKHDKNFHEEYAKLTH